MIFDIEQEREWLADLLPKSAHKHIDAILNNFAAPEKVSAVEVPGARVPVDEIEAYGLVIEVDANDNAVTVGFPHGAEISEVDE